MQAVHVSTFGAVGAGADETTALQTALNTGAPLMLTGGVVYRVSGPLVAKNAIYGENGIATILWTKDLGAGKVGLQCDDIPEPGGWVTGPWLENLMLSGSGGTPVLGAPPFKMDGVHIIGEQQPSMRRCFVMGFNKGVLLDLTMGHPHFNECKFEQNYYGVYSLSDAGDFAFRDCEIEGNTFAGIACPADVGYSALYIYNTTLGHQPYGIYQEPGTGSVGNFIVDATLINARFEAMGNGAIISAATLNNANPMFSGVSIEHPGFSWDTDYQLPGSTSPEYAIDVPYLNGLSILQGSFPFEPGTKAIIHAQAAGAPGWVLTYDDENLSAPSNILIVG